jgi:hypothetical protein
VADVAGSPAANLKSGLGLARGDELQHVTLRQTCIGILRSPSRGW